MDILTLKNINAIIILLFAHLHFSPHKKGKL
jgi:hypothetical protein